MISLTDEMIVGIFEKWASEYTEYPNKEEITSFGSQGWAVESAGYFKLLAKELYGDKVSEMQVL